MSETVLLAPPLTPNQVISTSSRPGSLSARLNNFPHRTHPTLSSRRDPESPTTAPLKRKQHPSPFEKLLSNSSPSPHRPPRKLVRQLSPSPEDIGDKIERILLNCKTDLVRLVQEHTIESLAESLSAPPTDMLQVLLDRCMPPSQNVANQNTVKPDLPTEVLDFITLILGQAPVVSEPPSIWVPPPFNEVGTYCFEMCMQGRETVDFGIFNKKKLRLSVSGIVTCWGDGDADLQGQGHMEIKLGSNVTRNIDVVLLGYIVTTGIAVLLDTSSQIWLYKTPNAVDPYLEGIKGQAALIDFPTKGITKTTEIHILEEYEDVMVELEEFKDEDE